MGWDESDQNVLLRRVIHHAFITMVSPLDT